MANRPDPAAVGAAFVEEHFPEALCVFVSGSFIRGQETPTSDLDIAVITTREDAPFPASYRAHGWPIEALVHTPETCARYFVRDGDAPILAVIVAESIVLRDTGGLAAQLQHVAHWHLARGPEPLSQLAIDDYRYRLTDVLTDLEGCDRDDEGILIAADLVPAPFVPLSGSFPRCPYSSDVTGLPRGMHL